MRPPTPTTGLAGAKVGRASGRVATISWPVAPRFGAPPCTPPGPKELAKVSAVTVPRGRVLARYTVAAAPPAGATSVPGAAAFAVAQDVVHPATAPSG